MTPATNAKSRTSASRAFLTSEAAGGILLMGAAALAMLVANSPFAHDYHDLLHLPVSPALTSKLGPMTPHLWINDGLMAVFFLLVGLEIKREFIDGRLSTWSRRTLPAIAAGAGMAVPALIYLMAAGGDPILRSGWAVPAATDIAFAIGVLALLGSRAPASLKLFLTTVAIVDDLGAVAIIAFFYTAAIDLVALSAAGAILLVMWILGRTAVRALPIYLLLAALLWYAVLLSGVHATVAGVLAAAMIPLKATPGAPDSAESPLHRLEHALSPIVAFVIVPIFGFANAGVALTGIAISDVLAPLPLGIAAGLFVGKQLGIFGAILLCVRFGLSTRLRGATWLQIYGVSLLCGIGFTMSLFIGALAFPRNADLVEEAKIGVLLGSIASAIAGYAVLRFAAPPARHEEIEQQQGREFERDGDAACIIEQRSAGS
ncbi:Na+/H+ antiporter NhaA [Sphingomonas sp. MG17]|uniref:Na(+)/H(+) antiporter NhaA n=1 Tax=Sphingomonas tagetis TaxID=2949092 RepID=A0A9X2KNU2_9SPHN|nr:Na+/H+ antiporter NhaA [Sphingomonas tagetis]MCP3733195.1 Na+/H+ antiporter NhaA [Sphingomonas tagetis]